MSAIAGILALDERPIGQEMLARMRAAAPPRGLDGTQVWLEANFGTIRQANATTPQAVGEQQPFTGPSGAVVMFDGRLDNRSDVLALLGPAGGRLAEAPDGALVLALYEKLGRDFVRSLVGDFAIAICHPLERRLALFTSPLNWRPLHWTRHGALVAFATDMRTLVLGLGLQRQVNEGAFAEFMSGVMMSPTETFLAGVERVEQGSAVFFEGERTDVWLWHDGPFEDWTGRSMADHVEHFNALFDQAVAAAFRSHGDVSAQLSGGLDSSSVVCRATELYRAGRLDRQVRAISARFPGMPQDETRWSSAVEDHLGIRAEVATAKPFSLEAARQWTASTWHLPLRPNALDTMGGVVDIMRADGRRVLLGGEGGDDWLNGSLAHLPDLLRRGRLGGLAEFGRTYFPRDSVPVQWAKALVLAGRPLVIPEYRREILYPAIDWNRASAPWLRPEWTRNTDLADRLQGTPTRPGLQGFTQRSRYSTYANGVRQMLAAPVVAYMEQFGIEWRHPLHDARLTGFCMGASGNHLRNRETRKMILREAMRGTLPEVVRMRSDKAAFYVNTIAAMEDILRERPFRDTLPARMGWVDAKQLEALYAPVRAWDPGGDRANLPSAPYGPIWFVLAADMWLDQAFGSTI
ncbi:asparagine synthetase B family protein [Alteraurantiacibacter buctensis]|uniref:asparagine synthase (glutamine-hydrolyzing) n=1 Tax=Alteraurantiacibacter buctensis TaxID=1503981 RepID=A0A844YUL9_9SPHN|nr:asparagine synthase-related protein [Alteraurantiacibacter buctensis]MXO71259.1 hypothetical protein [Alteraurantiacibacter buctensis]